MRKIVISFVTGLILLTSISFAMAQSEQAPPKKTDQQRADGAELQTPVSNALKVEEIRIRNRLDRIILQHGEDGPREYYEMGNANEIFSDGSLTERGVMRRWQFGNKKP